MILPSHRRPKDAYIFRLPVRQSCTVAIFASRELAPVGHFRSSGPRGTYDMSGNTREWLWTQGSPGR
jgi:formylglycine-generating enzyme required for sulfatase activity